MHTSVRALRSHGQGRLDGAPPRRGDDFYRPGRKRRGPACTSASTNRRSRLASVFPMRPLRLEGDCYAGMLRFGLFECGLCLGGRRIATLPHPSRRCRILNSLAARWEKRCCQRARGQSHLRRWPRWPGRRSSERGLIGLQLSRHEARLATLWAGPAGSR